MTSPALLNAPPAPFVPAEHHVRPGVLLVLVGFGSPDDHAAQCGQIRTALSPLFEFSDVALAVVELPAGTAAKLKIREGARVIHPAFSSR